MIQLTKSKSPSAMHCWNLEGLLVLFEAADTATFCRTG